MNIKVAADKPYATVVTVTPELAAEWLATNDNNRKLNKGNVKALAKDMTEGRWTFTGESIQFSREGRLLNGQHRLNAVIESGQSIPFLIVRGLTDDSQRHMDLGAKRSVADALTMRGVKNANAVATIGRVALMWCSGRLATRIGYPTSVEVQEFIFDNDDIIEAAAVANGYISQGLDMPPSAIGVAYWSMLRAGNSTDDVRAFFDALAEMRTDGVGDPKKALLQRFASRRRKGERLEQAQSLSLILRAWNAEVEGREVVRFSATNKDGSVTVPQPLVKQ